MDLVLQLFREIADALAYLEANDILQSDVKTDSIYYDQDLKIFVLADFDLAYYTKECFINRTASPSTRPPEVTIADSKALSFIKTFITRSPYREALSSFNGDVFSLAMTVSILLLNGYWYTSELDEENYNFELNTVIRKIGNM